MGKSLVSCFLTHGVLQNAPLRSQIFKIFFASDGIDPPNQNPMDVPVRHDNVSLANIHNKSVDHECSPSTLSAFAADL